MSPKAERLIKISGKITDIDRKYLNNEIGYEEYSKEHRKLCTLLKKFHQDNSENIDEILDEVLTETGRN